MPRVEINDETLQDIVNIETGLLWPLQGFMSHKDFRSVIDNYTLANGQVFTIPITLDIPESIYNTMPLPCELDLTYGDEIVAKVYADSKYTVTDEDIRNTYLTLEQSHPGVYKEMNRGSYRIGGKTNILKKALLKDALTPAETKKIFKDNGWETVVGFQTRNPVHRAHEHVQRIGLELCDGLFINPITGWKKKGDFTEEAVMAAYHRMMDEFYPKDRVYLKGLKTQMRYAGPREAIFHAIIRRNLGCTHFIIGRDHAGVGGFYGAYDAHNLARSIMEEHDLGINLLLTREPYYCEKCGQIVTDKTCAHYKTHRIEISGSAIRKCFDENIIPDVFILRKEIFAAIQGCEAVFI